jgi:hypothetical protein
MILKHFLDVILLEKVSLWKNMCFGFFYIPEDDILHSHCREKPQILQHNLYSQILLLLTNKPAHILNQHKTSLNRLR